MSSTEGIVDIEVSVGGELLRKLGDILLLLGIEADVLEEKNLAILHRGNCLLNLLTDAVISLLDLKEW